MRASAASVTASPERGITRRWFPAVVSAFLVAALGLTWWRLHRGADLVDEAYFVLVPWRWTLGDRPFVDEQNLSQSAGLLAYPFVKLFALVRRAGRERSRALRPVPVCWTCPRSGRVRVPAGAPLPAGDGRRTGGGAVRDGRAVRDAAAHREHDVRALPDCGRRARCRRGPRRPQGLRARRRCGVRACLRRLSHRAAHGAVRRRVAGLQLRTARGPDGGPWLVAADA